MEKGKLKNLLMAVLTIGFLSLLCHDLLGRNNVIYAESYPEDSTCDRIQRVYQNLLYRVWIDNPSYVEDVLNETDEWQDAYDVMGNDIIPLKFKTVEDSLAYKCNLTGSITYDPTCINWVYIPDSTYRKLRQVFPDLPANQNDLDSPINPVEPITLSK